MAKMKKLNLIKIIFLVVFFSKSEGKCAFEAIFNFGDSNSDTRGFFAAFPPQPPPYGMDYFKKPVGRQCDGRLFIDFLAQALGLPFVSPYLQSVGSDDKQGANFATSASTVLQPQTSLFVSGTSPFYLEIQLNQMKQFKARVDELHSSGVTNLPRPDIFGKSLYTFYIGQNDFTSNLENLDAVRQFLPQVVSQTTSTIKKLYALGGRSFLVLNLAPVGCYPAFLVKVSQGSSDVDASGCMISINKAVKDYNIMLKDALRQTRQELEDSNVVYVDTSSVLNMFQHPTTHGMQFGTKACCGYGGGANNYNQEVPCGSSKEISGEQANATACNDPQNYVSWDGYHFTEAANKLLAYAILNGSFSDPYFSFYNLCHILLI